MNLHREHARARLRALRDAGALVRYAEHKPLEFEGLMHAAGMPIMRGGDGASTASLRPKLEEANTKVSALEADAATKWKAFEKAREDYLKSGADPTDTASDAFKTLDDAGKAHDAIADDLHNAKVAREALGQMVAKERGHGGDAKAAGAGGRVPGIPAELLERALEVGLRVAQNPEYRSAVGGNVFKGNGKIGRVALGKAWDREELKTLLTTDPASAGAFLTPDRVGYYPMPQRPLTLLELITIGQTDSRLVQYIKQTLRTNAAGPQVTEGGAKPESAFAMALVEEAVKTLAHWVPAVKQALNDVGQLRTIIDGELRSGLDQYVMNEVISGPGTGGRLKGILNQTGIASPAALAADGNLERIHRGITAVRIGAQREPSAVGLHPLDWEEIRLRRDDSGAAAGTGQFLMGSPLASALNLTVWGLVPAVSTAIPQGTALVGDYSAAVLWLHSGTEVLASDSHADYFTHNMVAVLAEMEAAFGVPRPDAFAEVDLAGTGV